MKTTIIFLLSTMLLQSCGCSQARHVIHDAGIVEKSDTVITYVDTVFKYPVISDDSLMTLVQERTFRYFWDYAHPVSGLARERLGSEELVTIGGSGFGIMCIPVAVERGFISREEGAERIFKILSFLLLQADRFHGAYPHWMDGDTGKTIPFSTYDNGGDIVETTLCTVQQQDASAQISGVEDGNPIRKINLESTLGKGLGVFVPSKLQQVAKEKQKQHQFLSLLKLHQKPQDFPERTFCLQHQIENKVEVTIWSPLGNQIR